MSDQDAEWTMAASVAAVAAATVARKLLVKGWTKKTGHVPGIGSSVEIPWTEALTWAVVSGVVVGVTRLVVERGVVSALGGGGGSTPSGAPAPASERSQ